MKSLIIGSVSAILAVTPGVAGSLAWSDATAIVEHGGGCRKDSPPGQCCHAGSQPYHCH